MHGLTTTNLTGYLGIGSISHFKFGLAGAGVAKAFTRGVHPWERGAGMCILLAAIETQLRPSCYFCSLSKC